MSPTRRWSAVALVVTLLAAVEALAGERPHEVRPGESASAIALRYYGDDDLGALVLAYNGRRATLIRPGETLRIPYGDVHRVRRGDSWTELTRRYLGSTEAWRVVAELNGLAPGKSLQVGQEIVFPVVLEHRLARGESLAVLAERYYGDASRGRLLQAFNALDDPRRLAVGETVRVPLIALRLLPEPKPSKPVATAAVVQAPVAPPPGPPPAPPAPANPVEPAPRFTRELNDAERAFRAGDYERARSLLVALLDPVTIEGTAADQRELWRTLAFVHVAYDRVEEACSAFDAWARLGGEPRLDPDLISPKTRALLSGCASDDSAGR